MESESRRVSSHGNRLFGSAYGLPFSIAIQFDTSQPDNTIWHESTRQHNLTRVNQTTQFDTSQPDTTIWHESTRQHNLTRVNQTTQFQWITKNYKLNWTLSSLSQIKISKITCQNFVLQKWFNSYLHNQLTLTYHVIYVNYISCNLRKYPIDLSQQ
jgi:hypothetical protein